MADDDGFEYCILANECVKYEKSAHFEVWHKVVQLLAHSIRYTLFDKDDVANEDV